MTVPPPPTSPADLYDPDYYLTGCAGAAEWRGSNGRQIDPAYHHHLTRAGLSRGDVLVDIGTGRGELLAAAVHSGADRAIGVEYSPSAVELALQTIKAQGVEARAEVLLADPRAIPLPDGVADVATLLDVVEHLAPVELDQALREAHRLLRPGGRLLVHTFPNRSIYEVTYRIQRWLVPSRSKRWPADPRNDRERQMHVNEQTVTSLRRAMQCAGFPDARTELGERIYTDFVPDQSAVRLYHRLAKRRLTAQFGVANIWGEATRPAA